MRLSFLHFPRKRVIFLWLVVILLISSLSTGLGYYYIQYQKVISDPNQVSIKEVEGITKQVGKYVVLPTETPTLATVTDISILSNQPFFSNAQNGDKILIYTTERKVILYRPSTKKVINFAPLTFNDDTLQPAVSDKSESTSIKVAIYNGSKVSDLPNQVETKLKSIPDLSFMLKRDAQKTEYQESIVVDVSGGHTELANRIAATLDGVVGNLPEAEIKPDADLLIIVAK